MNRADFEDRLHLSASQANSCLDKVGFEKVAGIGAGWACGERECRVEQYLEYL